MAARSSSLQILAKISAPVMPRPSNELTLGFSPREVGRSLGMVMEGMGGAADSFAWGRKAAAAAPAATGFKKLRREEPEGLVSEGWIDLDSSLMVVIPYLEEGAGLLVATGYGCN